ncbi:MAG: hypothetical protein J6Q33_02165 [Alistipes sp.]|nr:hypothetical protein [Alistipes sp.]
MGRFVRWLYAIALVVIVCSVASMFDIMIDLSAVLSIVVAVVAVLLLVVVYRLDSALSALRKRSAEAEEQLAKLQEEAKRSRELKQRLSDALKEESEKVAVLETKNVELMEEVERLKGAYMSDAEMALVNFRDHITTKYLEQLRATKEPLSDEARQAIIDSTVDMAMIAFDMAETVHWTLSNREEQRLNMAIINDPDARQRAMDEAIVITDNPTLTPKWARLLGETFQGVVSKDAKIIYSGYKMRL